MQSVRHDPPDGDAGTFDKKYEGEGYDEKGNVIYQKDIEQVFHIQRSTATGILKLLEQSGSIRRECDSSDARMKRITVTEEALQHKKKIDSAIDRIENKLLTGLTEEEIKTYIDLTEKMRRNLES